MTIRQKFEAWLTSRIGQPVPWSSVACPFEAFLQAEGLPVKHGVYIDVYPVLDKLGISTKWLTEFIVRLDRAPGPWAEKSPRQVLTILRKVPA